MTDIVTSYLASPQADAAAIAGLVALATAAITAFITGLVAKKNINVQLDLFKKKIIADLDLLEKRVQGDLAVVKSKVELEVSAAERKRVAEFAGSVLADFYNAKSLFKSARLSWEKGDIKKDEQGKLIVDDDIADMALKPFQYLRDREYILFSLESKRANAAVQFGPEAQVPFDIVAGCYAMIDDATQKIIKDTAHAKLSEEQLEDLWIIVGIPARETFKDPVTPRIEEAVSKIEAICRPFTQIGAQ